MASNVAAVSSEMEVELENATYKECLKNHAVRIGRYSFDGCLEFITGGGTSQQELVCATCGCHRGFHRKNGLSLRWHQAIRLCLFHHINLGASIPSHPPPPPPTPLGPSFDDVVMIENEETESSVAQDFAPAAETHIPK